MRVYAVANQKGGVGKTSTTVQIAAFLNVGYRVLAVDLDAQCNFSRVARANCEGVTTRQILLQEAKITDAIQHCPLCDVIPASRRLAGFDRTLDGTGREYRLRKALAQVATQYDFVLLDTPPALSILTINALTAADEVIIPAQADMFSIEAVQDLSSTIADVQEFTNPNLKIAGILLTRYSPQAILSREITLLAERVAEGLHTKLFKTKIREAIALKEALAQNLSLFAYKPHERVTLDYQAFVDELLEGSKKGSKN